MSEQVHTRAMLAKLHVSAWSARKYDRKVSSEVNKAHGAVDDAGRYNKHLLGGKAAGQMHSAVLAAGSAARQVHYEQTLPWSDEGWRMLPTANFMHYTDLIRKARGEFDSAVADFLREYPQLRDAAKLHLNGLWNAEDYPGIDEIGDRFSCSVDYLPIPARGDLRIALPESEVAAIEKQVEDRVNMACNAAMRDAWGRLRDVVEKVRAKLSDPDGVFRDTLITNVADICDVLQRLNLTNDPALEQFRSQVATDIASLHPQLLRDFAGERERVADKAQEILTAMAGMYGGAV